MSAPDREERALAKHFRERLHAGEVLELYAVPKMLRSETAFVVDRKAGTIRARYPRGTFNLGPLLRRALFNRQAPPSWR